MSRDAEFTFSQRDVGDVRPLADLDIGLAEGVTGGSRLDYRQRLEALNELSDDLLRAGAASDPVGLPFLAGFLRQTNLTHLIAREVPVPDALERFVPVGGRKSIRLVSRGIVCHWIAGNVPLLGMFSWALSALVGNRNVIRLSTRQDDFVSPLVERLSRLSEAGRQLAAETCLVRFDREDLEAHRRMSEMADVRIAWGGQEAIDAIKALPCKWECDTIALGPRASLAVVDPRLAGDRLLGRLVTDVISFDQLACSSPQWLFVKGRPGGVPFDGFVERLCSALDRQCRVTARHPLDYAETYRIELDRTRVVLDGGSLRRDGQTAWTVALVRTPHGKVACANRFLQVVPFEDVGEVYPHIPANVQTVVTLLGGDEFARFTEEAASYGVCRFPRPGEGNHFESPWDGVPLVSRLTRWVVRTDAPSHAGRADTDRA